MKIDFFRNAFAAATVTGMGTGRMALYGACVALACMVAGCTGLPAHPHHNPQKSHHTPTGFKNNYTDDFGGLGRFLRWQWERLGKTIAPPSADLSPITPDVQAIAQPTRAQVTWIGHSSALIQLNGFNVLTDPIWSERASPVSFAGPKRHQAPGLALAQLPRIDAVVISHNHYDHLDLPSVRALASAAHAPVFYVPLGIDLWFKAHVPNARVQVADWSDQFDLALGGQVLGLRLMPVQHWSSRTPFDRKDTLWGSWVLQSGGKSVWFSGDLGDSQDVDDLAAQYPNGFDLALIAVGAYEPRWFMKGQHIDPAQAVSIHQRIRSRQSVGIHWGTFLLTDEALDQPIHDLQQAKQKAQMPDHAFVLLRHGQTLGF